MTTRQYFVEQVLPNLPEQQREQFFASYPQISFNPTDSHQSVQDNHVVMLVALTGTGKSTTLEALRTSNLSFEETLPSRRDIADFIVIPLVQHLRGEPFTSVRDRAERFAYTREFADRIDGGLCAAFSWLYVENDGQLIISEGIRGTNEIQYAIHHCPHWNIIELTINPLIRLERLSNRNDAFDSINQAIDLDFLPNELCTSVRLALSDGRVSAKAVAIMQAESENYGLYPANIEHPQYRCIDIEALSPEAVAQQIIRHMGESIFYA